MAIDGLTTIKSSLGPKDTMDRLEARVKASGMSVFARIDHAAGGREALKRLSARESGAAQLLGQMK